MSTIFPIFCVGLDDRLYDFFWLVSDLMRGFKIVKLAILLNFISYLTGDMPAL